MKITKYNVVSILIILALVSTWISQLAVTYPTIEPHSEAPPNQCWPVKLCSDSSFQVCVDNCYKEAGFTGWECGEWVILVASVVAIEIEGPYLAKVGIIAEKVIAAARVSTEIYLTFKASSPCAGYINHASAALNCIL
ncbi:MAG: hypothetical protein DRN04_07640 [Thermoprotei archaeon]|nr:MAG: hypothetical protein DRN04_07640 [Thermoprotei archaeon]